MVGVRDLYVGYCGVEFVVWDFCVCYCCVVVGICDSYVGTVG